MSEGQIVQHFIGKPSQDSWERVGMHKRAGILVPLFSVYSKNSLGIGDFGDLKLLVDLAVETGNSIIQLLPMNELGSALCPYDSLSSFALEPAYISVELLQSAKLKAIREKIEDIRVAFPAGRNHVDYGIKRAKLALLREIFPGEISFESEDFRHFRQENNYWLQDFALYKVLKYHHEGRAWYEWEEHYKNRRSEALEMFLEKNEEAILFEMWVQWQLYRQFKAVKEYASLKKVLLKGDLPILVSRDSADVWSHPEFFKLDFAAGAPPDMYCAKGQRWGMPSYNWDAIAFRAHDYLKERLKYAENFYDILRIDHVVGLFRIWAIPYNEPEENQGLHGSFDPPQESAWGEHGRSILSVIVKNTKMLLCAEDLGVIPKVCTRTLEEFGIPGNDVQRWVKDWQIKHDFLESCEFRFFSVAMLSTHDTTNWLAWWENEAGTVDDALFKQRCVGRVDYVDVKDKLFDLSLSRRGRLRWSKDVDSVDKLIAILGRRKEEIVDFIDMYKNTYQEKQKLWKLLRLAGAMREKGDAEILTAALKFVLDTRAIFSIQLISDWLGFAPDILGDDPYLFRFNTPGTFSKKNWSFVVPISLERLLKHPLCAQIKEMVASSGRA